MATSPTTRLVCAMLTVALTVAPLLAQDVKPNSPPDIAHDPVTKAIKGQALTMKAKVTDDKGEIGSVTLFYTLSKDAAPFRVPLKAAGLNYYVGTIDASVLAGVHSLSYYIEAQDSWGATRETPWYVVTFRDPDPGEAPVKSGGESAKIPVPDGGKESSDGIPLGLIAGGAAAVIGGALLIANRDSGGSSSNDDTKPDDPALKQGVYGGAVTTCLTESGQSPNCESHACTITIDAKGKLLTTTLREGQSLTAQLNGNDFTFTASLNDAATGVTGEIFYNGTVLNNNKIVGSITGSRQSPTGSGTFSGSFTANKQ